MKKSPQAKSKTEQGIPEEQQKDVMILYKQMAQDYWDRWQWEMHLRKEEMQRKQPGTKGASKSLHQIDSSQLSDPVIGGTSTEVYLGRGSSSIVQLKVYRGVYVAVKQFRTPSLKEDVHNEALLCLLSAIHTYFGVE